MLSETSARHQGVSTHPLPHATVAQSLQQMHVVVPAATTHNLSLSQDRSPKSTLFSVSTAWCQGADRVPSTRSASGASVIKHQETGLYEQGSKTVTAGEVSRVSTRPVEYLCASPRDSGSARYRTSCGRGHGRYHAAAAVGRLRFLKKKASPLYRKRQRKLPAVSSPATSFPQKTLTDGQSDTARAWPYVQISIAEASKAFARTCHMQRKGIRRLRCHTHTGEGESKALLGRNSGAVFGRPERGTTLHVITRRGSQAVQLYANRGMRAVAGETETPTSKRRARSRSHRLTLCALEARDITKEVWYHSG